MICSHRSGSDSTMYLFFVIRTSSLLIFGWVVVHLIDSPYFTLSPVVEISAFPNIGYLLIKLLQTCMLEQFSFYIYIIFNYMCVWVSHMHTHTYVDKANKTHPRWLLKNWNVTSSKPNYNLSCLSSPPFNNSPIPTSVSELLSLWLSA